MRKSLLCASSDWTGQEPLSGAALVLAVVGVAPLEGDRHRADLLLFDSQTTRRPIPGHIGFGQTDSFQTAGGISCSQRSPSRTGRPLVRANALLTRLWALPPEEPHPAVVDTCTGESHRVPLEAVTLHRRSGRYPALCGVDVITASLTTGPGEEVPGPHHADGKRMVDVELYSESQSDRSVLAFRDPDGQAATVIVLRKRGQVWLVFNGAEKTTVAMTDAQRDMLHSAFPKDRDKVISFNDLTGLGDVPDPIGGEPDEVRAVRDQLQSAMPLIFHELKERGA